MVIPQFLIPFKIELLTVFGLANGLIWTNILDNSGKIASIVATVIVTVFLVRMYISQKRLNDKKRLLLEKQLEEIDLKIQRKVEED